ncbi:hypothetical protein ADILRU_0581 [Leifsonia rubra CMS 76R]|nr:hypothetical protein ADILRU_0581 [Leifsonia rubra CMS 76R]
MDDISVFGFSWAVNIKVPPDVFRDAPLGVVYAFVSWM